MANVTKKALNFDLDTKMLKQVYSETSYTNAYYEIRSFLEKNGFEHRQGSGKSRYWLKPNRLSSMNESIVITDPKEEILKSCGMALLNAGYEIRVLNLISKWKSDKYNPLRYIRKLPKEAFFLDLDNGMSFEEEQDNAIDKELDVTDDYDFEMEM